MNKRMLILAFLALILSGGVTYLAYRVLQSRLQPVEVTSNIVVAAKKLEMGTRITKEDIKLAKWPKASPIEGTFNDINNVVDRALMVPVQVNEPILNSKLASKESGAGLMALIPEGMRGLSIQVDSVIGVSGFVIPGSRVDLILTAVPPEDVKGAKGKEMGSKIILENLEVLAAGQNLQRDVDGKPQTVQNVTLLVTPDQAQRVALASQDAKIQLTLRNPMDKKAAEPPLVVRSALYEGPTMEDPNKPKQDKAAMPERPTTARKPAASRRAAARIKAAPAPTQVAPPPPPPQPRVVVVELIQGSKRGKQSFEESEEQVLEQTETPTQIGK
jgi:pilus assembly protein CpaB